MTGRGEHNFDTNANDAGHQGAVMNQGAVMEGRG